MFESIKMRSLPGRSPDKFGSGLEDVFVLFCVFIGFGFGVFGFRGSGEVEDGVFVGSAEGVLEGEFLGLWLVVLDADFAVVLVNGV